jgi:type I restriction enzyme M protein
VDEKSTKIGYEISFTKYFYKPAKLREAREIVDSLKSLDAQADELMSRIMEGL